MDEDYECVKGLTRSETLFPRLPLINLETRKRQDGRSPGDVRPICKKIYTVLAFKMVLIFIIIL